MSHPLSLLALCLCLFAGAARAEVPTHSAGESAYFDGHWREAITHFSHALESHPRSPELWHNLGNAHFRQGEYGRALHAFRQAERLHPPAAVAEAISRNLDATQRTLQARHRNQHQRTLIYGSPESTAYKISHLFSGRLLEIAFALSWASLFLFLILRDRRPTPWVRRLLFPALLLSLLTGALLWLHHATARDHLTAIVVQDDATLQDGRHTLAKGSPLYEGTEVRIVEDDTDGWLQVETPSGRRGWVQAEALSQLSE